MNNKIKLLTAAVAAACSMGFAGQAAAQVYGLSSLSFQDLNISITPLAAVTGVTVNSFDFTLTNTATLNGNSVIQTNTCGGTPGPLNNTCGLAPVLNAVSANAPGGTAVRTDNTVGGGGTLFVLGPGANTYSTSDSVILTAELVNLGSPTASHQIAEAELQNAGTASANAEIQSQTGVTITFVAGGTFNFDLDFLADIDMRVLVNSLFAGSNSQANANVSISLVNNTTGGAIRWAPEGNGTGINDCTVTGALIGVATCTEAADTLGQDLNLNIGLTSNGDLSHSPGPGAPGFFAYGIDARLLPGGIYTLNLNSVTSTRMRQAVPEPATLALLGAGLAGLGFAARRQRKQA